MNDDKLMQRGFNAGYSMAKLDPALYQTFQASLSKQESSYVQGFNAGGKEWEREKGKGISSSYNPTIPRSPSKGKDDKGFEF